MHPGKHAVKIIKFLLIISVLFVLIHSVLVYTNISFPSVIAKRVLLEQIKTITQRDALIDGEVYVTLSLLPQLVVERIHIKNVEGFDDEDFITVSDVEVEISLLPLLSGSVHLEEVTANHAHVSLDLKKDGSHNWSFDHLVESQESAVKETDLNVERYSEKSRFLLRLIRLTDITIKYKDESLDPPVVTHLDKLLIDLKNRAEPQGEITGSVSGYPFGVTLKSDELRKLTTGQGWTLYGTGDIAGKETLLEVSVQLREDTIFGNIGVNVKDVNIGFLLEEFDIITGQNAAADEAFIKIKLTGKNSTELYQQADFNLLLRKGNWNLSSSKNDHAKELSFSSLSLRTS